MIQHLNNFVRFVKNIKTLHKVAIGLLFLSFLFTVQDDIESSRKVNNHTFELSREVCLSNNQLNEIQVRKCISDERREFDKYFNDSLVSIFITNTIIHIFYFTLYLVIFSIIKNIILGYRSQYNWSDLSKSTKVLHTISVLYVILIVVFLYLNHRSNNVELMFPVQGERKYVYKTDDNLTVSGVWVRDNGRSETLKEDIGTIQSDNKETYYLPSVSIYCNKNDMICDHKTIFISHYRSIITVKNDDPKTSKITSWNQDRVESTVDLGCSKEHYIFDTKNKNVVLFVEQLNKVNCTSGGKMITYYKLVDGFDLKIQLQKTYFLKWFE